MNDDNASGELVLHWVPVVDASGETRLEGVWSTSPVAVPTGHAA
jgi:hypothetical protein